MVSGIAHASASTELTPEARFLVVDILDDAASLSLRIGESREARVVLVVPEANRSLDNLVSLRLLARSAAREAREVAIVSPRRRLRQLAEIEGFATFPSVSAVLRWLGQQPDPLPSPFQDARTSLRRALAEGSSWVAALGIILCLLLLALLSVPTATVTLRPVTRRITGQVRLLASADASAPEIAKGILPARVVYLVIDSDGSLRVDSSSHPLDGRAVGILTLENRVSQRLTVPVGTRVSTLSGVQFATTRTIVLAPRPGASATVPIIAVSPGAAGNVFAGDVSIVDGPLRWLVTAVNEERTAGGGAPGVPVVTPWETQRLLDQVLSQARVTARRRLAGLAVGRQVVVPESIEITPIVESFDHQIGDRSTRLSVRVQARVKATIVDQTALDTLAMALWHPTLPNGFAPARGSLHVGRPIVVQVGDASVTFEVPLEATTYAMVNRERIAAYVRLRSPVDAERELARLFDLAAPPQVSIVPGWLPWAYRVHVVIDTGSAPTVSPDTSGG